MAVGISVGITGAVIALVLHRTGSFRYFAGVICVWVSVPNRILILVAIIGIAGKAGRYLLGILYSANNLD